MPAGLAHQLEMIGPRIAFDKCGADLRVTETSKRLGEVTSVLARERANADLKALGRLAEVMQADKHAQSISVDVGERKASERGQASARHPC